MPTIASRRISRFARRHSFIAMLGVSLLGVANAHQVAAQEKPAPKVLDKASDLLERFSAPSEDAAANDPVQRLQFNAISTGAAPWGYWGFDPARYSTWTNHSNRLIPVYTFGMTLDSLREEGMVYASMAKIKQLYGSLPDGTYNTEATYFDQTDVFKLQQQAVKAGKKNIILFVFDGMDWQTTQAAAVYNAREVKYTEGRGTGLHFQDYAKTKTDYGFFVTSPHRGDVDIDVDRQVVQNTDAVTSGGYDARLGGATPWEKPASRDYLLGLDRNMPHSVTDSASSATSLTAGIKTYNNAINVTSDGQEVLPIARLLQDEEGFAIGIISSVPISHATPASAYANNVSRNDYQDLSRDMVGLPSAYHRDKPLLGADVVLGAGYGELSDGDRKQGNNFVAGNKYLPDADIAAIDIANGGAYIVAQRTPGTSGVKGLEEAAGKAIEGDHRLFGLFGVRGGHLPYRTADGNYDATIDVTGREILTPADIDENPTLAEMTTQALRVLEKDKDGFWLMVESGDVDWANHANNVDNSIGAVLSGDAAFKVVTDWVEANSSWEDTVVILTADHGHYFNLTDPSVLVPKKEPIAASGTAE